MRSGQRMDENTNRKLRKISTNNSLLLILVIGVIKIVQILLKYLSEVGGYGSIWHNNNFIFIVQQVMIYLVTIPLLLLLYYKKLNKEIRFSSVFVKPQRSLGWIFKWSLIALGVSKAFLLIINYLLMFFDISGVTDTISLKSDTFGYSLYFISIVIFGPIFEELLFRATIFRGMNDYGELYAAVMSGIMFGLWHQNVVQMFHAVVIGFIFSLIFAKCRSIHIVIIIHSFNNLLVFLNVISRNSVNDILHSKDLEFKIHALFVKNLIPTLILILTNILTYGMIIAGVILAITEMVKHKGKIGLVDSVFQYTVIQKTIIFFSSPVTIITFAEMIYVVLASITVGSSANL